VNDTITEEIAVRVQAIRDTEPSALPPALLLGVMERVGSNWVSDSLRPVTGQHNEPFRQQISPGHPMSALNPGISLRDQPLPAGPYGRHWLVTFAAGKYAVQRQVIKETNLFFALPAFLTLFPGSPAAVLTRSPLGVTSSFARGGLFRRWHYQARYRQMSSMTGRPEFAAWAGIVPGDNPSELTALARLQVLNTLLLAAAMHERPSGTTVVIRYETSVLDPAVARAELARLVPESPGLIGSRDAAAPAGEDTFATTRAKTELTARLSEADAAEISAAVSGALDAGRDAVPGHVWDLARDWCGGDRLYSLVPGRSVSRTGHDAAPPVVQSCPVRWVHGRTAGDLLWRNLLVTNDEFAQFLNEMAQQGLPNCMDGSYLLAVIMPHERGGRLHCSSHARRWTVSPGYGAHPVYWVTWAGAAAFAARHGARLPTRAEMTAETGSDGLRVTNHGYQAGDTVPVTEPGRGPDSVHHLAGNLQVWCGDGPDADPSVPLSRWLHGAAWNTPGTAEEVHRPRSRHLAGASRGVGIRLVRGQLAASIPSTPAAVADAMRTWIQSLTDRERPLRDLDEALPRALERLQADSRLRAHIPATGKTGRDQFREPLGEPE
jgi:formylglycine-generating enzyme required for sulfatase activity